MSAIKIVADENIPALDPLFTSIGEVKRVPGRRLSAADLEGADLLLVRSVTQVNHDLLKDSQVKFVGTATIGTDHIDQLCLQDMGISFASAPGCNADAVTEYVLSVLLHLAEEQGFLLTEKTVGIVGVGNVGSRLQARLSALGVQVMLCDPPRAMRENPEGFVPLEQLLQQADIVTLHTPLTREGDHATHHLLNSARLSQLKTNAILINAGRGAVIDNAALLAFSLDRDDVTLVLDVWEHEPRVDPLLASRVKIATPHIAGYTLEGKIRGTWMLYQAYCRSSDREEVYRFEDLLPKPSISAMTLEAPASLLTPVRAIYDPYRDDRALRATLMSQCDSQKSAFDRLRKDYPVRREFSSLRLTLPNEQRCFMAALGFSLASTE